MLITKSQLDTIIKNAPPDVDPELLQEMYIKNGYEIEGVDTAQAKQYIQQKESGFTAPITETQEPEKQDGLVKTIAKDAVSTLVAKPAIRATEAATRVFAPNSMAAEGFGIMADRGETQTASIPLIGDIEVGQAKEFGEGGGRELASDALKVGSFLFPYGKVAQGVGGAIVGGSKLTPAVLARGKIGGQIASGVAGGYMADVGYNLADENKTLGESFIPGLGTALGAAIPLAGPAFRGVKAATKSSKTAEGVTKRVIQGQTKDIPLAQQAFSNIDLGGIKTRGELSQRLQDAMEKQMSVVDNELAKDPRALSLDNYAIRQTNNAGQEVKTDVISNALAHLEDFFIKAGDNVSASNIGLIRNKAVSEGLTHQEVNNIARMYAEEFGSKAFNKLGDPLTSVSAQMFENVRNGLKQAARGGLGFGEEAKVADRLYSAMNNTKRLIDKGVEGVNKLDGRLKQRNILQKLSNTAVKAMNSLTGGALKAGVEALGVSNVGNKIDNWIDLERSLQRDLEFIQKANTVKSENALIKLIEDYAKRLKFPGDKLLDDAQSRLTATNRIASNTKNITPSVSISKTIPQTSKKVKGEIPSKLPEDTFESIQRMAKEYDEEFTSKVSAIGKSIGLDAKHGGAKSIDGIKRKAPEYGGDPRKIPDLNRSAFLVDSTKDIRATAERVVDEAKKQFGSTARIKYDLSPGRYQKVLVNVETPVGLGEMQITSKKLWNAKKNGGDALYRLSRNKATPKEVAELLTDRGNEIYSFMKKSPFRKAVKASNEGGFTYDVIRNVDFAGTPHIAVSPYPERSIMYKGATSIKHLADFLEKNIDLLQKKGYAMGGWYNKANKTTYLDIVVPVNKKYANLAEELGNKSNQIAGFDLEDFVEIKYKGTGTTDNVVSLEERQALVDKILEGLKDI